MIANGRQHLANELAVAQLRLADAIDEIVSLRERLSKAEQAVAELIAKQPLAE